MAKILTGKDLAFRDGAKNQREWITFTSQQMHSRGHLDTPFTGRVRGTAVTAEVNNGRWVAVCECGGAEYVDPQEKVFYCFSCGNSAQGGDGRPVEFPAERLEIEAELLTRNVNEQRGLNALDRALRATPEIPGLSRSWKPGETVADLREQKRQAKERHQGQGQGHGQGQGA